MVLTCYLFTDVATATGGYDHGTSAGKGNLDLSLTWNPFNYFEHGQSYIVCSYGLTNKLDIHGYYSIFSDGSGNYYGGAFYQFLDMKFLDLATATGIRAYSNEPDLHLFIPQLLYTVHLTNKIWIN